MDTLRERQRARHGMGHANRPRQHHVISLDSQPGGICLSAGWRCQSNSNTDRIADSNSNSNSNSNRNSHCHGDAHSNNYTDREANADT